MIHLMCDIGQAHYARTLMGEYSAGLK